MKGKHTKKYLIALLVILGCMVAVPALALAEWPDGSQGGQYAEVNEGLGIVAPDVGVDPDDFIDDYNAAIGGPVTLPPEEQLANCEVLARLIYYQPTLTEYGIVYMNMGCGGVVPIDSQPPVVTNVGPSGTINTSTATLSADYYDLPYSSTIGSVTVDLEGNDVTSSCSVGATHVSCDVSGLVNGSYTVTVTVGDKNQPPLTATGSSTFNVVLCNVKPALSVTTGSPYWASYMNYMLGILSVHYNIHNDGPDAKQVTIQGIVPTNGVILQSYTPNVGDIATGGDGGFMARYSVPYVVHFFRTTIYASAMDECNNSYSYPGPYPGS